jgi:hypothetical protein
MYNYYYSLSFSFASNALLYCTIRDMFISIDSDSMCVVYTIPSSSCCPSCMYDLLDEILNQVDKHSQIKEEPPED